MSEWKTQKETVERWVGAGGQENKPPCAIKAFNVLIKKSGSAGTQRGPVFTDREERQRKIDRERERGVGEIVQGEERRKR